MSNNEAPPERIWAKRSGRKVTSGMEIIEAWAEPMAGGYTLFFQEGKDPRIAELEARLTAADEHIEDLQQKIERLQFWNDTLKKAVPFERGTIPERGANHE